MNDTRRRALDGESLNPDFGEGRWQDALRRMRDRIAEGMKLISWDSTTHGDKDTHCSWGMCSNDKEQWPSADDHVFPYQFENQGRIAPRGTPGSSGCPIDTRTGSGDEPGWGCFYHCRVFNSGLKDQKVALQLYDDVIAAREAEHGKKTADDDDEPWRDGARDSGLLRPCSRLCSGL